MIRVTLLDVSPPVWRVVRVPSAVPLSIVHSALQLAMGWEDRHLHSFDVGETSYGPIDDDADPDLLDESETLLADVAPAGSSLRYVYDFGDYWEHLLEVESVTPYDGSVPPLAVLDGARACPPEDCGGPHGYADLLAALANPDDLEHEEMVDAYGDYLDPDVFDRDLVNRRLEQLWRPAR